MWVGWWRKIRRSKADILSACACKTPVTLVPNWQESTRTNQNANAWKFDRHSDGNIKESTICIRTLLELSKTQIVVGRWYEHLLSMQFKCSQNISNPFQCDCGWIAAWIQLAVTIEVRSKRIPVCLGCIREFWWHSNYYATWIAPRKWSEYFECWYNAPRIFQLNIEYTLNIRIAVRSTTNALDLSTTSNAVGMFSLLHWAPL